MTERIEGVIKEVRNWSNGKGADVILDQDPAEYFYNGKVGVEPGQSMILEVVQGDGKKYEILNAEKMQANPAIPMPKPPPQLNIPGQPPGQPMIQMPMDQFQAVIENKAKVATVRAKSLENACKVYAAMGDWDKDPKAAADKVVQIARILEGYLA